MSFLAAPSPRWFNISAGRPFLDDLASGLLEPLAPAGPEALAAATVLLPTRRAGRELADAFLRVSHEKALVLPQVRALGDLEEGEAPFEPGELSLDLPPPIEPLRRRFELARLCADHASAEGRSLDAGGALDLADALAAFLDSVALEEAEPLERLDDLAPAALARHWQASADFLRFALEAWPRRLAELGVMDVGVRRVALLRRLAERWDEAPPTEVVVVAGSTGTAPAVAGLLAVTARLPKGAVVLPGLDLSLAELAWADVGEQHPQWGLKRLLGRAGVDRAEVRPWRPEEGGRVRWRRRLVNEALRPPEATADWLAQIKQLRAEGAASGVDPLAEGLAGLAVVSARTEDEAATAAALLLREALETPGRTAALVTPDAALSRRVSAKLTRWGVVADSSAGLSLANFPIAALMSLMALLAHDPLDPVVMLGVAKHPLARLGLKDTAAERGRWNLELVLRGPRLSGGWAALAGRLTSDEGRNLLDALRQAADIAAAPFEGGFAPVPDAAQALAEALETAARDPAGKLGGLWEGAGGEAAARLLAGLIDESQGVPGVGAGGFAALVQGLLAETVVRGEAAVHPRIGILGAIEARLVHADHLILAGLEEGVWPPAAPTDPFLSRPMREKLGLPSPERRIGLSAHDFAQGASAPEVTLISCERRDGAPAVKSRWLWRLQTLTSGAGLEPAGRPDILELARRLDAPLRLAPAPRPRPRPPLSARPRELPVTGVELWLRDPYAIYARYILKLRPLDRPGEPMEARARGTAVHAAFERFMREHPGELPPEAEARFAEILLEALSDAGLARPRLARERALAAHVAPWVTAFEGRRRAGAQLFAEQKGQLVFAAPGGPFTLTARADRIELRGSRADVLDFKTGSPPTRKQVESGLAPQLTLTAAILAQGGFSEIGRAEAGQLVYVRIGGRGAGAEEVRAEPAETADLAARALAGLRARVAAFDLALTPYPSWAAPQFASRYAGDYDHLARVWEWRVVGEGAAEEGG
jgi:ATP-dependent helicase/nuclease subunit B